MMTPLEWDELLPSVEDCLVWMERRWSHFKNEPSENFRKQWRQLFEAYRQQIIDFDDPEKRDALVVLSPCTGSGKSLSCLVFSALLCLCPVQPGGRVVVRTMDAATKLAEDINSLTVELGYTGPPFAIAWHSREKKRKISKAAKLEALAHLSRVPLIVTCHRGLEISLGHLAMTGQETEEAEALANFNGEPRRFFCIDECANFIQVATVEKKTIKLIIANLTNKLESKLASTVRWLQETINREDPEKDSVCVEAVRLEGGKFPKILELRHEMRFLRLSQHDHDLFEGALTMLHSFVRTWTRYKKRFDDGTSISTSKLLLGPEARGAVVLDATAIVNKQLYELFGKRTRRIEPVKGLRTYRPVTLHLAKGHNVGKHTMAKQPKKMQAIAHELLKNLPILPEKKTGLLITHGALELVVKPLLPPGWNTTHWGLHDGSNDWTDCDVVVIFGLQLLPEEYGAYLYDGYSPPDAPPIHTEEEREKIYETLKQDACGVAVIQGASRGSCRKVVGITEGGEDDGAGFCPAMDIYMLVPENDLGEAVIVALKEALPNHTEVEWRYNGPTTRTRGRVRPEKREEPKVEAKEKAKPTPEPETEGIPKVLAHLLNMEPGPEHRIYRKELAEACGVSDKTVRRITSLFNADKAPILHLQEAGVFTRNDEMDNRSFFEKRIE